MERKKKILVVDDDKDVQEQLAMILNEHDYDLIMVSGEAEAEEALMRHKPDLAILDVMMEHRDSGFILSHQIKKFYPNTPIIILTSVTSITNIGFNNACGEDRSWIKADAFLNKPIRPEHLESEVRNFLN